MNDKLLALLKQVRAFWASLSNVRRAALVGSMLAVGALVLVVSYYGSREHYAYLFTDLSTEDATAIAQKLKEQKVPFQIAAGGTAIEVPDERVHELRLELAGNGLPRGGGVGFEIFDKAHLGSTEFEQHLNLRRALEGELSRTISTIGAVQSARVHLVLPERSVFTVSKETASASVVLRLRPGRVFGGSEIASIVHLMASAVPGLSEDRISIVSADGMTLHRPRSDGAVAAAERERDAKRELSSALELQARELLERAVGVGHADVRVSVELDPTSRERTEEHYEPSKSVLRSEQRSVEKTAGTEATGAAGVPGAESNLPTGDAGVASPEPALPPGVIRQAWTRNWEVDKVVERSATSGARIVRLTVAVLVDGTYRGEHNQEFVPRDKAELEHLEQLVRGAVGFSAERGDVIHVHTAPFSRPDGNESAPAPPSKLAVLVAKKPSLVYGVGGGLAILVAAAVLLVVRRRRASARRAAALPAAGDMLALEADRREAPALPPDTREQREQLRSEALEIAARDPATAANILREWLNASPMAASART